MNWISPLDAWEAYSRIVQADQPTAGRVGVAAANGVPRPAPWASRLLPAHLRVGVFVKAECGKTARSVVRPEKAGESSGSQSRRGNNRKPRSLNGRQEGNRLT